jgi:drug/metabolite transporter (DMT)-like permease
MTDNPLESSPPFNPYFALVIGVVAVSTGAIFARLADAPALVNTNPLWVGLLTPLIARERINKAAVISIIISVIGGIIIGLGDFATGKQAL